ncbi:MAG: methyltransferase domain-containing protein [Candidatus Omnitrophica bacterium]|nr:methyltransferase domain-containing protein [Candidatus Omnitrophota bacterium]
MNLEMYKNIPYQKRDCCMVCGRKNSVPAIELPHFPLTELYVKKKPSQMLGFVDQEFYVCSHCDHGQIGNVIDIKLQYGDSMMYNFRTSQSITGRMTTDFFIKFFERVSGSRKFKTIVEVGCNDLYLLKKIRNRAKKLVGIDPILKGHERELSKDNIIAIGDFLENTALIDNMDAIICKDVVEHVADPVGFLKRIVERADGNAVFFVQVPLLETIMEECRFDQIFHQHLNYFSFKSFLYMINGLGCDLLDMAVNYDHWGTGLFAFKKGKSRLRYNFDAPDITNSEIRNRYIIFKSDLEQVNKRLTCFRKEKIYGYGAALMLAVLSYHMENDFSRFACIMDDDKNKDGMSYLNLPVSIVHRKKISDLKDAVVLLTAISSKINVRRMLTNLIGCEPRHIICPLKIL